MTEQWERPKPHRRGYRNDLWGAVVLAIACTLSIILSINMGDPNRASVWVNGLVVIGLTAPLALRRRFPGSAAIAVTIAFLLCQLLGVGEMLFSAICLFIGIFTVGAWGHPRRRARLVRLLIILALFLWTLRTTIIGLSRPELLPSVPPEDVFAQLASYALTDVLVMGLFTVAAYYFGNIAWAVARSRAELKARTAELMLERERSARQAVALDRVRIARELHDVVAHHVSVMGVQAGAARRVLDRDPDQARESLGLIEESARSAIEELHQLLATLRESDPDGLPPQHSASESASTLGINQLPALVEQSTAAGTPATLRVTGEPQHISRLIGFTLYRVVQEALTNVRKHAGEGAGAEVALRYLDDRVELEVTEIGGMPRAAASPHGSGLGQQGMRERVTAVGGALEVGPHEHGGYLVRASIPFSTTGQTAAITPAATGTVRP